ncbi:phospholipase D family protein [Vibrio sinaloensis]|uniref:phospholipase D family protein n=1 Tax=Photobacterium sp. (strain ATCC 43367) TaxID=379097 RepID=UPI0022AF47FC|nr:phospholipase D family protein [Vibrio sinaloensis]MCZ4293163.1 phospholipase D family protein [Vibrio sinaloensis]
MSPYFTDSQYVEEFFNKSRNKSLKLVISLNPSTHPASLRRLFKFREEHGYDIQIRYIDPQLHSKLYVLASDRLGGLFDDVELEYWAMVGSSNMTKNGFYNNIETNVILRGCQAKDAYDQAGAIFNAGKVLTESTLSKFEEEWSQPAQVSYSFTDNEELPPEYELVHQACEYIKRICSDVLEDQFSNYPTHFVIDHFYHYIVDTGQSISPSLSAQKREIELKSLFRDYAQWCGKTAETTGFSYLDSVKQNAETTLRLFNKSTVTTEDLLQALSTFHSFKTYDVNRQRLEEKGTPRIIKAFIDDLIDQSVSYRERFAKAQRTKTQRAQGLAGIGASVIQEVNGWVYPDKYYVWNNKTDKAIVLLNLRDVECSG